MAEEFKACLISLGYDVENDKQVGAPEQQGQKGMVFVRPRSGRAELRSLPDQSHTFISLHCTHNSEVQKSERRGS